MIIHIPGGKGRKDRDVMLSPTLFEALREYWRGLRRKPTHWLFPGGRSHTGNRHISPKTAWHACEKAARRSGIRKKIHPHTLIRPDLRACGFRVLVAQLGFHGLPGDRRPSKVVVIHLASFMFVPFS